MTREQFREAVRSALKDYPALREDAILTAADQYAAHLVEQHAHNGTGPCQASVSAVHAERQRTREAIAPLVVDEPDGGVRFIEGVRWVRADRVWVILGMGRSWDG